MILGIISFLWILYFLVRYYESGAARAYVAELHRVWRGLGIPGRIVFGVLLVMFTLRGGSKAPDPVQALFRQLFWHADDIWALRTATDSTSRANAAASDALSNCVSAVAAMDQTAAAVATQTIATIEFDWPMESRTPPHDRQNVMAYEAWRTNTWIDGKLYHDHLIRFNAMVSTNPAIISIAYNGFDPSTGERVRILSDVVTNSYPDTVLIQRPSGVQTCYMFRCAVPSGITNAVIGWDSEVVFGSTDVSGRGFNISGVFVVSRDGNLWLGRSYTNYVYGATNVYINGLNTRNPTP